MHWSVGQSVGQSIGPSKIAKSIGKSLLFACLCLYIARPTIILSFCPSFCPSVSPSIHPYVCNQILKIAKSIASIGIQLYNQMETDNIHRMKKNIEKKYALKSRIVARTNFHEESSQAEVVV